VREEKEALDGPSATRVPKSTPVDNADDITIKNRTHRFHRTLNRPAAT